MSAKNNFQFESEEEAILALRQEGYRLLEIAIKVWNKYESDYRPKKYVRTHRSRLAFRLSNIIKVDEETLGVRLDFVDDLAYHPSIITGGEPKGHSFILISEGWKAKKLERKFGVIEHFTRYKGYNYIGQVISEFEEGKHEGISIDFMWKGNKFKSKHRK